MMFREIAGTTIAISQPSHAWLSGQIISAWGNAAFGPVTPYEDVCLGAEQHDIGWLTWEQAPTLNNITGRPHSFRELSIAAHTAIWRRGTEMALALGRYPALLVSLHGTGLYASFDARTASRDDATIVRDFVDGQMAVQRWLIADLRADADLGPAAAPGMIERNRGLVRTADRISIAICTAMRDPAVRTDDPREAIVGSVPTVDGETDVRLLAKGGDMAKIVVAPWPFATSVVRVRCEGVPLPLGSFRDETEMRETLRAAPRVVIAAELVPE